MRAYKYKCKASKTTIANIGDCLYLCRNLYNGFLKERIDAYRITKLFSMKREKYPNLYSQKRQLPFIKAIDERYKKYPSNIFQDVCARLEKTYRAFFNGGGFAKFKGKDFYNSFVMSYANGYSIDGLCASALHKKQMENGYKMQAPFINISGIGRLKLHSFDKRKPLGVIQQVTVTLDNDNGVWVVLTCKDIPTEELEKTGEIIGIDVGIEKYLSMSDGQTIDNPSFLKNLQNE
jgi:putative transposase